MSHHARGTFAVRVEALTPAPAEGISRFSIDKEIHGDLEATTKGEMFSAGDPKSGTAGYVAIEVVTGTLAGRHGAFALQHSATMDQAGRKMSVIIVPGSGTGGLKGISGTFDVQIANGSTRTIWSTGCQNSATLSRGVHLSTLDDWLRDVNCDSS